MRPNRSAAYNFPLTAIQRINISSIGALLPHLLFFTYIVFFAAIVLTNNVALPTKVMRWAVLPCFVLSVVWPVLSGPGQLSLSHIGRAALRSVILWATLLYLLFLILATAARNDVPHDVVRSLAGLILRRSFDVSMFVLVTAYLTGTYENFFKRFFLGAAAILSVGAAVNLAFFVRDSGAAGLVAGRLSATFGTPKFTNPTHVGPLWAAYALAALALAATIRLTRVERTIVALTVAILVAATLATQARGAIGALAIGSILIAVAASWRWRVMVAFTLCCGLIVILAVPPIRETMLSRGGSFRFELWKAYSSATLHQNPWLGFGLQRQLWIDLMGQSFEQPHNTVVWAYVRGGVGAGLACVTMLFASVYWTFQHWRRIGNMAPLALIAALLVTTITEIGFLPWSANWLWLMFWLPLGVGIGTEIKERLSRNALAIDPRQQTPEFAMPNLALNGTVAVASNRPFGFREFFQQVTAAFYGLLNGKSPSEPAVLAETAGSYADSSPHREASDNSANPKIAKASQETQTAPDPLPIPIDPIANETAVRRDFSTINFRFPRDNPPNDYAAKTAYFGKSVADAFPSARYDIGEAAVCLSLHRPTACVMHLMRVVEVGLRSFAAEVGEPYRNDWSDTFLTLDGLTAELVSERYSRPDGQWLLDAALYFRLLRSSIRQHAMHLQQRYDDEEAEMIFYKVQVFMKHLALKLHEYREPLDR